MERIDERMMMFDIVDLIAKRTTCLSRGVGAILVRDGRILSTGYNGAVSGQEHCLDLGYCYKRKMGATTGTGQTLCRAVHAEQNAIVFAAKNGIRIDGSIMYVNTYPCSICAKMIINAGIKKVYYKSDYQDDMSKDIMSKSGIEIISYDEIIYSLQT